MAGERNRRSVRLKGYNYATPGAYFITICAHDRASLFGEAVGREMQLNEVGRVVAEEWTRTGILRPNVEIDTFVVMPNHVHGVLVLHPPCRGTARRAPTEERFGGTVARSAPTIVRAFKSAATKRVNVLRRTPSGPVWQRGYYERIIRNEEELNRARQYILENPVQWATDQENPAITANLKELGYAS